jgi:hypothetical protein
VEDENGKMMPGKYRVVYTVTLECDMEVKEGDDFQDAISNIDIPEGGSNNSVYCENTFRVKFFAHENEV